MKVRETVYCDICRTTKDVDTFWFRFRAEKGEVEKETHLCPLCQKRILEFIALHSGGAFDMPHA